jgi:hypothetical protein
VDHGCRAIVPHFRVILGGRAAFRQYAGAVAGGIVIPAGRAVDAPATSTRELPGMIAVL